MSGVEKLNLKANAWSDFLFRPTSPAPIAKLRIGLCVITSIYFVSSMFCVGDWLVAGAPFASEHFPSLLQSMDLSSELQWSPLYLADSFLGGSQFAYQLYLLVGVALCVCIAIGRGGIVAPWALWFVFVGWANRLILLSGLTEVLLSLALFATAFLPPRMSTATDWKARFSSRLLAIQTTIFAAATSASMLAQNVWWNGTGSFALAAPTQDRLLGLGEADSILARFAPVYELLTHSLVIALPLGIALAWSRRLNRLGVFLAITWCLIVAVLGSHWLYGATLACSVLAIPISNADAVVD